MTKSAGLYEKVLGQLAEGASLPPPRPPRASASVVLWRRGAEGFEVYWVRRSPDLAFMGGWHAFPGGGLSRGDGEIELAGTPRGLGDGPADAGIPEAVSGALELATVAPPGLVACAVRELFEEAGVLPSNELVGNGAPPHRLEALSAARRDLLTGERRFVEIVADELGDGVDLSLLTYAGRWLTPPLGPLRFDNRFFLLEWPATAALQPSVIPGELAGGEWVRPAVALAAWQGGEVITAPPILHILKVIEEDGPSEGLGRLRNPVEANLGPHRRIEFRPGVLLFPMETPTLPPARHTNAYLLGHGEAVLVDPGSPFPEEIEALHEALTAWAGASGSGRRVTAIWLTHHHPDHVGGVAALREALGVPVLAHPLTAERLRGLVPVDGELGEGQTVVLEGEPAMTVRVLHTPGHARGHLAFYEENGGSLIAGDVVAGLGTLVIDPPEGNMEQYLETLARLRDLAPRTLFPSHGPTLLQSVELFEGYIRHRLERERRVLAAWRAGRRLPAEIVPEAYDDLNPLAVPLAERQVEAHLERLRQNGEIE